MESHLMKLARKLRLFAPPARLDDLSICGVEPAAEIAAVLTW